MLEEQKGEQAEPETPGVFDKMLSADAEDIALAVRKKQQNESVLALKGRFTNIRRVKINVPDLNSMN